MTYRLGELTVRQSPSDVFRKDYTKEYVGTQGRLRKPIHFAMASSVYTNKL